MNYLHHNDEDMITELCNILFMKLADLKRFFQKFDIDKNGVLGKKEFIMMIQNAQAYMKNEQISMLFDSFDTNHEQKINYIEMSEYFIELEPRVEVDQT